MEEWRKAYWCQFSALLQVNLPIIWQNINNVLYCIDIPPPPSWCNGKCWKPIPNYFESHYQLILYRVISIIFYYTCDANCSSNLNIIVQTKDKYTLLFMRADKIINCLISLPYKPNGLWGTSFISMTHIMDSFHFILLVNQHFIKRIQSTAFYQKHRI